MAARVLCLVTKSDEGKGAYAVRCDNDENVYFPLGVADALELEEFEEVEAIVVKNDHPGTPWKAIRARRPVQDLGSDD